MNERKGRPGAPPQDGASFRLRNHQDGDMDWVIHTHGALYAREYQWDATFEDLVAQIVADFVDNFDAARERCWIAERDGQNWELAL